MGGGKGIFIVKEISELKEAIKTIKFNNKEIKENSGYENDDFITDKGCTEIFVTKIIENSRHIELQALRDKHSNTMVLGTRDCFIQTRHQKIIEEGPATLRNDVFNNLNECALILLRESNYVGVATIEFLIDECNFYLLEINTR